MKERSLLLPKEGNWYIILAVKHVGKRYIRCLIIRVTDNAEICSLEEQEL
jgi:hypothetical protein